MQLRKDRLATDWKKSLRQLSRLRALIVYGAKGAPVSFGLLAVVLALGVVGLAVGGNTLHHDFALGIMPFEQFRVWTALTAGLFAPGVAGYVFVVIAVVVAAAPIERRFGSAKFALAAASTQVLGSLLGLGVAALAKLFDADWGFRLHVGTAIGPTTWIVGVVMVATARMDTLWRRRIRVGLLALLITSALFSGHLQDVVRLAAAVVGLALGPVIVGRSARGPRLAGTQREGRVLVALVVAASALGPVLAALSPDAVGPFAVLRDVVRGVPYTAAEVREICADSATDPECRTGLLELRLGGVGPTILSLMPSIFLLFLADGLRRGRKFAWGATVFAQVVLLIVSVANYAIRFIESGDDESVFYGLESPTAYRTIVPFLLPLAVLILLLLTRKFFDVSAPKGTYRRWTLVTVGTAVVLAVLYVLGGLAARSGFDNEPTALGLLADFPQRLVPPVYLQWLEPRFLPGSVPTTLLFEWTGVLFWGALCIVTLNTFLTPAFGAETDSTERARELLTRSTGSALSWMTTWRGNTYWFSPDGRSYVAYRVISGVALTTGDPVGPRERLRDSVVDFAEFASKNGWIPCFYSVTPAVREITDSIGWGGIQVGEETILDLEALAFTGKRFQDVRTALNRAKKAGVEAEWISFPEAPLAITDQITAISEEWVADKGMPEMGFTLGGLEEVDDAQVRCLIAVDEHRTVHGVTSWMPVYEDGQIVGWTLDFMRRRSEGFRPAMEFLIASAAILLKEEGVRFLSLSGAPLAKIDDGGTEDSDSEELTFSRLLDRLLDVLGKTLEPVYGFRSLLAFKSKFQPRYEPMHMTYADPAALPSIGNAVGRAYLPEVSFGQGYRLVKTMIER
ncbi:bifunctional lysylphosphatidylglycerol flippase/synthetase MprF [Rhodococcoides yunnanense]|uniref:bifunctional lysylphosphatidylglycerol flippase/synthetase MprF n=1 Tax=Rhodococcoides yunnanense TaxID=278209 RepID=UPI001114D70C|nr:phosphatidylglycerol lysyltransferase domain-containing protein [Rhodococcus yunnanensis]